MIGLSFFIDYKSMQVHKLWETLKTRQIFHGSGLFNRYYDYKGKDIKPGQAVPVLQVGNGNGRIIYAYRMSEEIWGWRPSFYIETLPMRDTPGLLSQSKGEAFEQYYLEFRRGALMVSHYYIWSKVNGRAVRYKVQHKRSPLMFIPCVLGESPSRRRGFSVFTTPASGHLAEIAKRQPVIFSAFDAAAFMEGDNSVELLRSGSIDPDEFYKTPVT